MHLCAQTGKCSRTRSRESAAMEAGAARHGWLSSRSLFPWPLRRRRAWRLGAEASVVPGLLSCGFPSLASAEPRINVRDCQKYLKGLSILHEGKSILIPHHTCPKETVSSTLTMLGQLRNETTLCR